MLKKKMGMVKKVVSIVTAFAMTLGIAPIRATHVEAAPTASTGVTSEQGEPFGEFTTDNGNTQKGWLLTSAILADLAKAERLVIETTTAPTGGITLVWQGNDGADFEIGWTQANIVPDTGSGGSTKIVVDLAALAEEYTSWNDLAKCTGWGRIILAYYSSSWDDLTISSAYFEWDVAVETTTEQGNPFGDFTTDNGNTQKGWLLTSAILADLAKAERLVIETTTAPTGGITLVWQGNDGADFEIGWTQANIVPDTGSGGSTKIVVDLAALAEEYTSWNDLVKCTGWGRIILAYYSSSWDDLTISSAYFEWDVAVAATGETFLNWKKATWNDDHTMATWAVDKKTVANAEQFIFEFAKEGIAIPFTVGFIYADGSKTYITRGGSGDDLWPYDGSRYYIHGYTWPSGAEEPKLANDSKWADGVKFFIECKDTNLHDFAAYVDYMYFSWGYDDFLPGSADRTAPGSLPMLGDVLELNYSSPGWGKTWLSVKTADLQKKIDDLKKAEYFVMEFDGDVTGIPSDNLWKIGMDTRKLGEADPGYPDSENQRMFDAVKTIPTGLFTYEDNKVIIDLSKVESSWVDFINTLPKAASWSAGFLFGYYTIVEEGVKDPSTWADDEFAPGSSAKLSTVYFILGEGLMPPPTTDDKPVVTPAPTRRPSLGEVVRPPATPKPDASTATAIPTEAPKTDTAAPTEAPKPDTAKPTEAPEAPMQHHEVGEKVEALGANDKLVVGEQEITFPAIKVEGYNFIKLRDLAFILNGLPVEFGVGYDPATNTVTITTGKAYEPVGDELKTTFTGGVHSVVSRQRLIIDGKEVNLTAFNVDGYNYFRLRDLMKYLGFTLSYENNTVTLGF